MPSAKSHPGAGPHPGATSVGAPTGTAEPAPAALTDTLLPAGALNAALAETLAPTDTAQEFLTRTSLPEVVAPLVRSEFPVTSWDHYEFLKRLGQGSMGVVYKARDKRLNRIVALKFIHGGAPNMVMRFMQEARAQARIDHPHVCKIYETGEVQGNAYIAMQCVNGRSLDGIGAALSLTEKVVVIRQVAEAIHEAHRLGIIHRDIKPANIMIERAADGRLNPLVMDFGLARESNEGSGLTESGMLMGTPAYMAPEQARGDIRTIDRRADVYSLGATLYELIVGVPPFDAQSIVDLLLQVITDDPLPLRSRMPAVAPELETIVMKCLNKQPNQRYASAKGLADDLQRYLNGEPILGRRVSLRFRLQQRAKKHRALVAVSALSLIVVLTLSIIGLRQYWTSQRERNRVAEQTWLAQRLGQEITTMEWMLRSARQLPLHNLGNEKIIIREHMAQLQKELASYGELGRGLAHYALGRGYMALHEYPPALAELEQALANGQRGAEVHYALGFVLGKHYEQAMYEARLSGGGDWAKKQLKELEPKYLAPAIAALQSSRAMKGSSSEYLEALISYYKHDDKAALQLAVAAKKAAPWLYETSKLAADIHLARALEARDSGHHELAKQEFAAAVQQYEAAAAVGQSDAQVYEGLAEAWVRQAEMANNLSQPTETFYAAAVQTSDKILAAEPESVEGPLKKAFAAQMTMAPSGTKMADKVALCLRAAEEALRRQPRHPYASDAAANCYRNAAEIAQASGQDPEPLLRKGIVLLEAALLHDHRFLWGLSDLGNLYAVTGRYQLLHGKTSAKSYLEKTLQTYTAAATLDATFMGPPYNQLETYSAMIAAAKNQQELADLLVGAADAFGKCTKLNSQWAGCHENYLLVAARAALRIFQAGEDPQPQLARTFASYDAYRKLGGNFLDAEQHAALAHWVDAADQVRKKRAPGPALSALQTTLDRCLVLAAQDVTCQTLAAQAEWLAAEWLTVQNRPAVPVLQRALTKSLLATASPELYPDKWQVLAETRLRLARAEADRPRARDLHLTAGLAAVEHVFAINPNHALARATLGGLLLLRAQSLPAQAASRTVAQSAAAALAQATSDDPFLSHDNTPLLAQAKELAAGQ